jgi:hypothetical protein
MTNECSDYERLCDLCDMELAAAESSGAQDVRVRHLEQALRYAQKATKERTSSHVPEPAL